MSLRAHANTHTHAWHAHTQTRTFRCASLARGNSVRLLWTTEREGSGTRECHPVCSLVPPRGSAVCSTCLHIQQERQVRITNAATRKWLALHAHHPLRVYKSTLKNSHRAHAFHRWSSLPLKAKESGGVKKTNKQTNKRTNQGLVSKRIKINDFADYLLIFL